MMPESESAKVREVAAAEAREERDAAVSGGAAVTRKKTPGALGRRLAAAAVILTPLIGILIADYRWNLGAPGIWLIPLGLLIAVAAAGELLELLRATGHQPLGGPVLVSVSLIFLAACVPMLWGLFGAVYPVDCPIGRPGWPFLASAVALGLVFVGEMRRYRGPGGVMINVALAVLVCVYVGVTLSFAALLRQFHDNGWGMAALVSVIVVVKCSDTGAYFVGRALGRHKMSPQLSPGKTIEGACGGFLAGAGASWLFFRFIAPSLTGQPFSPDALAGVLAYGVILALFGLFGDLAESLMKRDVALKDSSRWLPGLGGVLDIMDSLLFALPAAYVCWAVGLIGPR